MGTRYFAICTLRGLTLPFGIRQTIVPLVPLGGGLGHCPLAFDTRAVVMYRVGYNKSTRRCRNRLTTRETTMATLVSSRTASGACPRLQRRILSLPDTWEAGEKDSCSTIHLGKNPSSNVMVYPKLGCCIELAEWERRLAEGMRDSASLARTGCQDGSVSGTRAQAGQRRTIARANPWRESLVSRLVAMPHPRSGLKRSVFGDTLMVLGSASDCS